MADAPHPPLVITLKWLTPLTPPITLNMADAPHPITLNMADAPRPSYRLEHG